MAASPHSGSLLARERAQASVELIGTLPFILLAGALAWQLALAGHATWSVANAARVAARAEAVGQDGEAAARSALPRSLERGLKLEHERGGQVRVSARVPLLLPRWGSPVKVGAAASLQPTP